MTKQLICDYFNHRTDQKDDNKMGRATLSSGTVAAPISDVVLTLEREYVQQMESLEVLPHRIQSKKVAGDICTKQSQICNLEQESAAALDGLAELEDQYATLKSSYDQEIQKTCDLEKQARQLFSAAEQSLNPVERINARKAELKVAESRPSILRQSIALEELDLSIQEKKQRSLSAEAKIEVLKVGTENDRAILSEVEQQTISFVPTFSERLPPNTEQSLSNIRVSVENMVTMICQSLENAESLLDSVKEAEDNKTNIANANKQSNTTEKRRKPQQRKTRIALHQELEEVRSKVEEMVPLYWVGHHTRAWRMEKLRSEKAGKKGDSILAAACWTAQNEANAKADGE